MESNKVINGTYGSVWFNGEELSSVKQFESKVNFEYADIKKAGSLATFKKLIGWNGEGTMTIHKTDSFVANQLNESIIKGTMPIVKIIAKLADPNSNGAERVAIKDVTVNELMLTQFEVGATAEQEVTFNFSDYEYLDKI